MICDFAINQNGKYECNKCHYIWPSNVSTKPLLRCTLETQVDIRKPQSEILISYLATNQPLTMGALIEDSKCGCQNRGREAVEKLITEGKIRRDNSVEPAELWVV